jgi:hypothetical protein
MNCEELEPWVSAYQDHELDPRRRRIVEAHLAVCRDCRALADGWADLARDLRGTLCRLEPPEQLHSRVMRQIPVSAAPVRTRAPFRWPQGRPSFALVPLSAAAAWLLWGAHPALKAPAPPSTHGAAPTVQAFAAQPRDGTVPAMLPGSPLAPQYATLMGTMSGTGERTRTNSPPKESPVPGHSARVERSQGHRPVQEDSLRRLRRLRPRRARYVLVQYRPVVGRRRHHSWPLIAARPRPPAVDAAPRSPAESPQIRVVEYVLPAVQAPIPAADTGTDHGQRAAQPASAVQAGFDL